MSLVELITAPVRERPPRAWWLAMAVAAPLTVLLVVAIGWLLYAGVGIWGVNIPVAWGLAIVNFVWWIGIGHAGTFISAFLLLTRQRWRTSINRFAEAMTLFAVCCAGLFPLLHLGRPFVFYFLLPYPNTLDLWPQWRSPLVWDVFAVGTYLTVSVLFWYTGLIPDLAVMRDTARGPSRYAYGLLALGWRGSARHWQRYQCAYWVLGALAAPLVVSVHSIVSLDFAASLLPGWHDTIFPPFFVTGAIFSGFAMTLTLAIPLRKIYALESVITREHLDKMGKVLLAMGLFVAYGYSMEIFMSWYSSDPYERFIAWNRATGPYAGVFWLLIACNVVAPQLLWFPSLRNSIPVLFCLSLIVNLGMWLERFVIVVISLHRDFLPSAWGIYIPTFWDWAVLAGTLGLFFSLFLLFVKFLPAVSISESLEQAA